MINYREAFYVLKKELENIYESSEATAIAHEVLESITGFDKTERLIKKDKAFTEEQFRNYQLYSSELKQGKPMQQVLGFAWFLNKKFIVDEDVLIPRPETEELVQWVADDWKNFKNDFTVLDIGTGSGCIAISLKLTIDKAIIEACDISDRALEVANKNASALQADVSFFKTDILSNKTWSLFPVYDVVISNPPYIPLSEKNSLHKNVREYEPALALFTDNDDALQFYAAIANFGQKHLSATGFVYCECHAAFAEETEKLFLEKGYSDTTLRKDMYGKNRMLRARK